MRNWITFLMTLLVGSSVSYANADAGQVSFEAGYRRDNINWTHQWPSCDPFFKNHTKFKDIDIFQIGLKAKTMMGCNFYGRASAYWGWILDGDFEQSFSTFGQSVYGFDDFSEAFEFKSRNRDVIDDKYVYDLNIAIGYPFFFCDCTMAVAPVIGYSVDEQHITVDHEGFDFESCGYFLFPTQGSCCCTHNYVNRWYGPFIGLDLTYRPCGECWSLYAELEYHWAHFKSRFHDRFNGSDSSGGFFSNHGSHSRHGHGWVVNIGADYDLSCDWTIGFAVKVQDYNAHRQHRHCNDDSLFSDFSGRERTKHKWNSTSFNLAFGKIF
ncbi:MAG: hypothetical protein LW832_00425 [Parachlamydia sp.]|jgi:hypothetical protein|nr:hypothetical protein [Parachlamydia sp.]